jgi:phage terminase small subunit
MAVLKNAKHELFAQELAKGVSASEAYVRVGYKPDDGNASKLSTKVQDRVQEITSLAAAKCGVTIERVVTELAKIGFADIRKAVDWSGVLVTEEDNPDGGDVLVIKHIHSSHVRLISAADLDDDTAGAIAEVKQSPTGGLSLKLHDKRAALVDLGKHLGMFKDKLEVSGNVPVTFNTLYEKRSGS